jgi:hypothetical protein
MKEMQYCLQMAAEAEVLSCSTTTNHIVGQQRKH